MTTAEAGQTELLIILKLLAIWSLRITSSDRLSICATVSVSIQAPSTRLLTAADAPPATFAQVFYVPTVAVNVWVATVYAVAKVKI